MRRQPSLLGATAIALAVACVPAQAWIPQTSGVAPTSQILFSRPSSGSSTQDFFSAVGWATSQTALNTDTLVYSYFSVAGRISGLLVNGTVAQTGTVSQAVTLYKNGSASAVTCTLDVSHATQCTSTGTADVVAGDYVSWLVHPTNGPASSNRITTAIKFTPTTANDTVVFGQIQGASTSGPGGVHPFSNFGPAVVSSKLIATIPDSGTIDRLFVNVSVAPGAAASGKKYDLYVDKGGTRQSLTTTVLETATTNSDVTHSFSVTGPSGTTAGDSLQFEANPTSTPAAATIAFGARFVPATAGSFWINAQRLLESATSPFYYPITSGTDAGSGTEASFKFVSKAMTVTKISVKTDTAVGLGHTRNYILRVNGADSSLSCTMTNTSSTFGCTASGSVTINEGDLINYSMTTSGGATGAATTAISLLAHP